MIDNIILLITGTLHQRPITELVPKCHPLGSFEEMASINIASTPAELYNAVMIDTPLGENRQCITWFHDCHSKVCMWAKWPIRPELNPLTPVPPVTACEELWPFSHFWHHHFWPKLASSILNFGRRKRSFQWCPDQSDRPNGALDMHKNAQKVEWKTQSKISCHCTWLLHAKICPPSRWCFLRSFLTASKPSRRSITAAKRKEKEKKGRRPKNSRNRKAYSCKFWILHMPKSQCGKMQCWWQKRQAVVLQMHFHWIEANLAGIQLKKHQNVQKTHFFCQKFQESMG